MEEVADGQQPQKEKEKAGLLSRALRAPLGTRTMSLHNLLDQASLIEGQQVKREADLLDILNFTSTFSQALLWTDVCNICNQMSCTSDALYLLLKHLLLWSRTPALHS